MLNGITTRSPLAIWLTSEPISSTIPIGSWPRMSPSSMNGPRTSYRCRSDPQIAVEVMRTMASVGSRMLGSGTVSTRTSWFPCQATAFMGATSLGGRAGGGALVVDGVLALGELLDDLRAEGLEVVRVAARHESLVDHNLLVDDLGAGVAQVGADARVRSDLAPAGHVRLDEDPRAVADRPHRLAGLKEVLDEADGVLVDAQVVRVDRPSREDEALVVVDRGVADLAVDRDRVALVDVGVHRLDLAGVGRKELGLGARLLHGLARLVELDVLDAVGGEDRDLLSLKLVRHGSSSVSWVDVPERALTYPRAEGRKRGRSGAERVQDRARRATARAAVGRSRGAGRGPGRPRAAQRARRAARRRKRSTRPPVSTSFWRPV